jgi:hypothetical protein
MNGSGFFVRPNHRNSVRPQDSFSWQTPGRAYRSHDYLLHNSLWSCPEVFKLLFRLLKVDTERELSDGHNLIVGQFEVVSHQLMLSRLYSWLSTSCSNGSAVIE